jgi:hypothetical protein
MKSFNKGRLMMANLVRFYLEGLRKKKKSDICNNMFVYSPSGTEFFFISEHFFSYDSPYINNSMRDRSSQSGAAKE